MVVKEESPSADAIEQLTKRSNVAFKVCQQTMERHGVAKDQLVAGVQTVPDGILEIAMRQADGWGYIKESHN
jgi:intracellular sulfur oxidation DsrE/DsrF family protein